MTKDRIDSACHSARKGVWICHLRMNHDEKPNREITVAMQTVKNEWFLWRVEARVSMNRN